MAGYDPYGSQYAQLSQPNNREALLRLLQQPSQQTPAPTAVMPRNDFNLGGVSPAAPPPASSVSSGGSSPAFSGPRLSAPSSGASYDDWLAYGKQSPGQVSDPAKYAAWNVAHPNFNPHANDPQVPGGSIWTQLNGPPPPGWIWDSNGQPMKRPLGDKINSVMEDTIIGGLTGGIGAANIIPTVAGSAVQNFSTAQRPQGYDLAAQQAANGQTAYGAPAGQSGYSGAPAGGAAPTTTPGGPPPGVPSGRPTQGVTTGASSGAPPPGVVTGAPAGAFPGGAPAGAGATQGTTTAGTTTAGTTPSGTTTGTTTGDTTGAGVTLPDTVDTNGYAKPGYAVKGASTPLAGYDSAKWNDPNHQSPKYVVGRIMSQYPQTTEGLKQAMAEIIKAYPGATQTGDDTISIPGVSTSVDVVKAGGGFWWHPETDASGNPYPQDSGSGDGSGGGGGVDLSAGYNALGNLSTSDVIAKIIAQLGGAAGGQGAGAGPMSARNALLGQLGLS